MATITQEIRDSPLGELIADLGNSERKDEVKVALDAALPLLNNRQAEIDGLFDHLKIGAAWSNVMIILGSEIEVAVKDILVVPEYSQKASAKQDIYVFVGTHWKKARTQIYYDFVKEACRRIGLSEVYVQNQQYMNQVFENVAFRMSKHIVTCQPEEGVWINMRNITLEVGGGVLTENFQKIDQKRGGGLTENFQKIDQKSFIRAHSHRASDFFKYALPYDYDPEAKCPMWQRFLDEVLPDKDSQKLLGEYIGYCFTQNLKLEKMLVFYGSGANGKSVILDIIKKLFGRSNVSEASLSNLTNDPESRALLQNKLVNISSESGKNLNNAILKQIISGEPVEMRILYVGTKQLYNPPKLITSYNQLPPVENSYALKRRWILIPFNVTIAETRQDPGMADKLALELSGILNWVLECLSQMMQRMVKNPGETFTKSEDCNEALSSYFKSANSISMFLEECCHIDDRINTRVKDLYASYQAYCRVTGINKPSILKNFKKALEDWGAKVIENQRINYANVYVDTSVYN